MTHFHRFSRKLASPGPTFNSVAKQLIHRNANTAAACLFAPPWSSNSLVQNGSRASFSSSHVHFNGDQKETPPNTQQEIPPDMQKELENAFQESLTKAKTGDSDSQVDVAIHYLSGTGVSQNAENALEWINKAAQASNAKALAILGIMFENGMYGQEKDPVKAVEYYKKAADLQHPGAQVDMGRSYFNGHGVEQNHELAFKYFQESAEAGHPEALFWVGTMYEQGNHVAKDMEKAVEFYQKARENGDELAAYRLSMLENQKGSVEGRNDQ